MGIQNRKRVVEPVGDHQDPQGFWQRMRAWLAWRETQHVRGGSVDKAMSQLLSFLLWCDERGLKRPSEVTLAILERYQRHLYQLRKSSGQPLSVTTQRTYLNTVRSFFSWMTRRHHIQSNPAADLQLPRKGEQLPQDVLSVEEVETLLGWPDIHTPDGLRDRAMLEVLYSTGIRRAELAELTLYSINSEQGTLMVRRGKGGRDRLIPIGERACQWVRCYLEQARPQLVVVPDETRLFISPRGLVFRPEQLGNHVARIIRQSGVRKTGSCHLLRHSMATLMLENGADTRWIQKILGHADLSTTQIYTRVSIQALKVVHEATHPAAVQKSDIRHQKSGEARRKYGVRS